MFLLLVMAAILVFFLIMAVANFLLDQRKEGEAWGAGFLIWFILVYIYCQST